ncbi:hypothetical protein P7K49_003792, partial [Saguinus oedipus]
MRLTKVPCGLKRANEAENPSKDSHLNLDNTIRILHPLDDYERLTDSVSLQTSCRHESLHSYNQSLLWNSYVQELQGSVTSEQMTVLSKLLAPAYFAPLKAAGQKRASWLHESRQTQFVEHKVDQDGAQLS